MRETQRSFDFVAGLAALALLLAGLSLGAQYYAARAHDADVDSANKAAAEVDQLRFDVGTLRAQIPEAVQYLNLARAISGAAGKRLTPGQVTEISRIIWDRCRLNADVGLEPALVAALIERESGFDPKAVSERNAYGLMQMTQEAFEPHLRDMGLQFSARLALDPVLNVECGTRELVRLRRYWVGQGVESWATALNSYFWGVRGMWAFISEGSPDRAYARSILLGLKKWREIT